ncbi:helix-turn-helix domain-containing protein [Luteimonas sp. TWI1416]|uniref:helix-turn-helix domain-containing protein n=1 Tax=unclassified Luteimonas TaxID=2629088 RepID=UPI003207BFAC
MPTPPLQQVPPPIAPAVHGDDASQWRVVASRIGPDAAGRFERVGDGLRLHFDDGAILTIRHLFPAGEAVVETPAQRDAPDQDTPPRTPADADTSPAHPASSTPPDAGRDTGTWRLDGHGWHLVSPNGHSIDLTLAEQRLLARLAVCPGHPVARATLIHCLADDIDTFDPHRLEVLVHRLRRKCSRRAGTDLPLRTVHGLGYMLIW